MKRLILFEPKMNLAVRGLSAKLGDGPADTFFKDNTPIPHGAGPTTLGFST